MELFTEHGYEATSLREVAERLGVTKAALYYHFNSKDEIVTSVVEDWLGRMDALIAWAESQPATPATRRAVIERYADMMFSGGQPSVMRFFEQNQTALKSLSAGRELRGRMFRLSTALCQGDESPRAQLRTVLALFAVHSSWFAVRTPDITDAERKRVALEVANELLAAPPATEQTPR
nr:TetR/AcrR family transcriptional regulator [Micromonospora sp. HNM0581]